MPGIKIQAYNLSFNEGFTDEEIDRGFLMAKALGADFITASATLKSAQRVAPFADKHKYRVAMHNHANIKDPNEFATPESFAAALAMSKYFVINLDIGHFTAANYDAVAVHRAAPRQDRQPAPEGPQEGPGRQPALGRRRHADQAGAAAAEDEEYDIPANIEYQYKGADTVAEVKKCFEYREGGVCVVSRRPGDQEALNGSPGLLLRYTESCSTHVCLVIPPS